MLISKDNDGRVIGWMETYFSDGRTVTVNVGRDITMISTQDRATGRVKCQTIFGKPPLPGIFEPDKT